MANAILKVIVKFLVKVLNFLLSPINSFIATAIPSTSVAFTHINAFFDLIGDYGSFALSYLGISTEIISICIILYTAIITIPMAVHVFKLIAKWWEVIV